VPVFGYATGVFSSRKIGRRLHEHGRSDDDEYKPRDEDGKPTGGR
jgi:hypothetical protein